MQFSLKIYIKIKYDDDMIAIYFIMCLIFFFFLKNLIMFDNTSQAKISILINGLIPTLNISTNKNIWSYVMKITIVGI